MTTSNCFSVVSRRFLLTAGIVASGMLAVALPSLAQAATYAYVNQSGEVSTVTANDPMSAMAIAPSIHPNSGVMLLVSQLDFSVINVSLW